MESELIEHELIIDEYIQVKLKIPQVLDAITFKAITTKANKLFNLSEVTIPVQEMNVKQNNGNMRGAYSYWSEKQTKELKSLIDAGKSVAEIAEFFDCKKDRVKSRITYLGCCKPKIRKKSKFSTEEKRKIIKEYYKDKSTLARARLVKKYNFRDLSLLHKNVWNWRNKQKVLKK